MGGNCFVEVLPGMLKFTLVPVLSPIGFQAMKIKVNDLSRQHSVFNQYMAEIRDVTVQWIRNRLQGLTLFPVLAMRVISPTGASNKLS